MPAPLVKTNTPGVYKRGNRYAVVYRDADGRQRQESVRTYDEARRLRSSRISQVDEGIYQPQTREKLADYAREWVERYQGRGRRGFREVTRDDYRRDLERYVLPFFGAKRLEQITPRDVARLVAHLCDESAQGRYLADATVRRILSPLRACLASAVAEGLIRHNPTTGIALRWADVELDGSSPHVHVRRAYVKGRYGPPKSRHSRRRVPIDHGLVTALRARRADTEWSSDDSLIFPALNGEPLRPENVRRRVLKPAAEEAGVGWAGFHTFRHTAATRLFAEGRNAVQVSRWLGHHSPAFTLSVYVHLLDGDLGEALPSVPAGVSAPVSAQPTGTDGNDPGAIALEAA